MYSKVLQALCKTEILPFIWCFYILCWFCLHGIQSISMLEDISFGVFMAGTSQEWRPDLTKIGDFSENRKSLNIIFIMNFLSLSKTKRIYLYYWNIFKDCSQTLHFSFNQILRSSVILVMCKNYFLLTHFKFVLEIRAD